MFTVNERNMSVSKRKGSVQLIVNNFFLSYKLKPGIRMCIEY